MAVKFDPERGREREEFYMLNAMMYFDNIGRVDLEENQTLAEIEVINANRLPRYIE